MKNLFQIDLASNILCLPRTFEGIGVNRPCLALVLGFGLLTQKPAAASDFSLAQLTDGFVPFFEAKDYRHSLSPLHITPALGNIFFSGDLIAGAGDPRFPCVTSNDPDQGFTVLLPGGDGCFNPEWFTSMGTKVYFAADDNMNGRELWVTDGTSQGTRMVKNIFPGPSSSSPTNLTVLGNKLYFVANDGVHGRELWISDGTPNGTQLVKDIFPGISNSTISQMFSWNGAIYFSSSDRVNNEELWRSNGTASGTYMVKDISSLNSYPTKFTSFNNKLYFQASSPAPGNAELWQTDGTTGGTVLVKAISGSSYPIKAMHVAANQLFFSAPREGTSSDYELWRSDGTPDGTYLVKNINPSAASDPHSFAAYGNQLYFVANNGPTGDQIWRSNGTESGTVMVHEIYNPTTFNHPNPRQLLPFGDRLFFAQERYSNDAKWHVGLEWFSTDGTSNGIKLVADIEPGPVSGLVGGIYGTTYFVQNNELFFTAATQASGMELWKISKDLQITTHPQPRLVFLDQAVNFSVAYAPSGGAVQWQQNRSNISGATSLSYSIAKAALSHAGNYRARVSLAGQTKDSSEAALGVVDPYIKDAFANQGGTLLFKVSASGPGIRYQWKRNGTSLSNDSNGRVTGVATATLQIKNVTSADSGNYTCAVSLGGLSVTTNSAAGAILSLPVLTASPTSTLARLGQSLTLTAGATGGGLSFQWYRNGGAISGATSSTYTVAAVTASHFGKYHCRISNGAGSINTGTANIVLLDPAVPGVSAKEGGSFTLNAKIHIPSGISNVSYRWRKNSSYLADGPSVSGSNSPQLVVKNVTSIDSATYTCRVTFESVTIDTAGAVVAILAKPVMNAVAAQTWSVSQTMTLKVTGTHNPAKFIATGLPPGVAFESRSGQFIGKPNRSGFGSIRVSCENVAGRSGSISIPYTVLDLPSEVKGSFDGLVARNTTIGNYLGGWVSVSVSSSGGLSGSMRMADGTYRFKGRLDASVGEDPVARITVPRGKLAPFSLTLNFDTARKRASGPLSDGIYSANVRVDQRTWSAKSNPASTWAGTYNMVMDLPEDLAGNEDYPQGSGFARMTLKPDGAVRLAGKTGDGMAFALGTYFWRERYVPVFALMHTNKASLRGLIRVNAGGPAPDYPDNRVVVSNLDWFKNESFSTRDKLYGEGFGFISLNVDGSKWVVPERGSNVLDAEDNGFNNAQIVFARGGQEEGNPSGSPLITGSGLRANLNQQFRMDGSSRCFFDRNQNSAAVAMKVNSKTGLINGSYKVVDRVSDATSARRTVKFEGLMLQHRKEGFGFFQAPSLQSPGILAGQVFLSP